MTETLSTILTHFLLCLSLGTALFTWIADPKLTGAGFIRLITGHAFIFLAIATGVVVYSSQATFDLALIIYALLLIIFALQWRLQPDRRTFFMWSLFGVQVILSFWALYLQSEKFYFLISSALLLGITHYAMLLGHYYLVVPKLTEKPLLVSLQCFWAILIVKIVLSAVATVGASLFLEEGTVLGDGYTFNWLVISMRWLWGYGALGFLSWFAWRLCRMRSIQSATGVLYIMVFFVFIGELLSVYLFFKHGLMI